MISRQSRRTLNSHASRLRWSQGFTLAVALGITLLVQSDPQGNVPLAYMVVVPSVALLALSCASLWIASREPYLARRLDLVCAWLAIRLMLLFALRAMTNLPNFSAHQCAPGEQDYGYFTDQSCLPNATRFRILAVTWSVICIGFARASALCFWAASLLKADLTAER